MLIVFISLGLLQDDPLVELSRLAARRDYAGLESGALKLVERDPASATAWFFLGHARAALERFEESLEPFRKAIDLGLKDAKVRFQYGYAAQRAGKPERAVPPLEALLAEDPGHEEGRYWLGLAYLDGEEPLKAEATLSPLAEGTGSWRGLSRFHRGRARLAAGKRAEGREDLEWVRREGAPAALREKAGSLLAEDEPVVLEPTPRPGLKQSYFGMLRAGYDSNVPLLSDTSASQGSGEGTAFLMGYVSAEVELLAEEALQFRLQGLSVRYAEVPRADLISLQGILSSAWTHPDWAEFRVSLQGEGVFLDDDFFYERSGVAGEIRRDLPGVAGLEASLELLRMRKSFDEDFEDLDSHETGLRAGLRWSVVPDRLHVQIVYGYLAENARAGDFDHEDHRGELRVTLTPEVGWELQAEAWVAQAAYAAPDRGSGRTRRDEIWGVGVRASWQWLPGRLQIFLDGEIERLNSRVGTFDRAREAVGIGLALSF